MTVPLLTAAGTTSAAGLNIAEGVAPTSPNDGDIWVTAAGGFFARLNGVSVDLSGAGGAATDLATTGADVNIDAAAPPTVGQILTATSATTATWQAAPSSGIANVVEDTTPQLGGDLDVQTFNIISTTGNPIDIIAANGSTSVGSPINITAGDGDGFDQEGGAVIISSGTGGTTGTSPGGAIQLIAADGGTNAGVGGGVLLQGGDSNNASGGDIDLHPGQGTTAFNDGDIRFLSPTGSSEAVHVRFYEGDTEGTSYIELKAPNAVTSNRTWVLPLDDPSSVAGQFLQTDASGNLSFAIPAGLGDVTKVGTPVDNQVGVWTGDGTLEGTAGFTYTGSRLSITGQVETSVEVLFTERADHIFPPAATRGILWVRDDSPNVLVYTDDAGTDHNLIQAGSGDVTKVGTPVNNEIGVWTGDGTIEGDTNLQWDGTSFENNGEFVFTERADHAFTPAGTRGILWVRDDTPNRLIFTDDAGTDHDLTAAGGAGSNLTVVTVTTTSHTAAAAQATMVDDDTAASTVTITLPAGTANDQQVIKKLGSTANVIVDGDGSETIDGATTFTLTAQYASLTLIWNGTEWSII